MPFLTSFMPYVAMGVTPEKAKAAFGGISLVKFGS